MVGIQCVTVTENVVFCCFFLKTSETAIASCTANWYEFEILKKKRIQPQTAGTLAQLRFT